MFHRVHTENHQRATRRNCNLQKRSTRAMRTTMNSPRSGKILVVTALLLVALFGFAALAVDSTYLMEVNKETQNAAEAAALAGSLGLVHPDLLKPNPSATNAI